MKAAVYQVIGYPNNFRYSEVSEFDTMREARAAANERNRENANQMGKSLREYMNTLSEERKFYAGKTGLNGWRIQ